MIFIRFLYHNVCHGWQFRYIKQRVMNDNNYNNWHLTDDDDDEDLDIEYDMDDEHKTNDDKTSSYHNDINEVLKDAVHIHVPVGTIAVEQTTQTTATEQTTATSVKPPPPYMDDDTFQIPQHDLFQDDNHNDQFSKFN